MWEEGKIFILWENAGTKQDVDTRANKREIAGVVVGINKM